MVMEPDYSTSVCPTKVFLEYKFINLNFIISSSAIKTKTRQVLDTVGAWGPDFHVKMEVLVFAFPSSEKVWGNVLKFTKNPGIYHLLLGFTGKKACLRFFQYE